MEHSTLFLAEFQLGTYALGPGFRAGIWVQGCPFHCSGCISPEWTLPGGKPVNVEKLALSILEDHRLTGITISGGEPMQQAPGLLELLKIIHSQKPELTVICFTGYRYQDLRKKPSETRINEFLSFIDLLIDGPYIKRLNDNIGLRGSSNQKFIYLTDRLKSFNLDIQPRRTEVKIQDNQAFIIGIPPKKFFDAWENAFPPLIKES